MLELEELTTTGYYVMRTHSGVTSNVTTWKLMSRRFRTYDDAENWMDFCEGEEKNKRHRFFIISQLGEKEAERVKQNEREILQRQMTRMHKDNRALNKVATVVDKIRHSCDNASEQSYIRELLGMFEPDSGDFKYE